MKNSQSLLVTLCAGLLISNVQAGIVPYFDTPNWTDITQAPSAGPLGINSGDDLESFSGNFVYPGWGGQPFDAEYLFFQRSGSMLSIGLQTGFDINDGRYGNYWGGDLALSFNSATPGDAASYEFAIDFGNVTRDYTGHDRVDADNNGDGIDDPGLYRVTAWNNDIYFDGPGGNANAGDGKLSSAPFAMDEGSNTSVPLTLLVNESASVNGQLSYYRAYEFDLAMLGVTDISTLDAHWTMSCGNDAVDGQISLVPEPSVLLLLSTGISGLWVSARFRRRKT